MNHTLRVYESMLELLSNEDNPTPIVRLARVTGFRQAKVYAKLEWYNPFGAVKDRVANNLVAEAEAAGSLFGAMNLVEATSGNTGMGLAMIANHKGYRLTTPLSNAIPAEKRAVLRFFGCDVVELDDSLCPAPGAPEGAIAMAKELGARPGALQLNQYENEGNPGAHYKTTGPEIWRQTGGRVTHFVAGLGTCGTITGTGRFLKEKNPTIRVIGVHPAEGHDIPGVRSLRQLSQTRFYFPNEYDGLVEIDNAAAFELCHRINLEESIIAGPSSGMALAGALRMIPDEPDVVAVVVFPDNIFKYASSVRKHLSHLFPATGEAAEGDLRGPTEEERLARTLLDAARASSDLIDVGRLETLLDDDPRPLVIDVRSPAEYDDAHIEGSINIPLDGLAKAGDRLPTDPAAPVVTVCNVGKLSLHALLLLKARGHTRVHSLMGGLTAWQGEGMPVEMT